MNINHLTTEQRNDSSMNLDELSPIEFVKVMNAEDKKVALAIKREMTSIANLIEHGIMHFKQGGRLIYLGAGTSGRLGVLDAAECVPTFGTDPSQVVGLIAGGAKAMTEAIEGAEDDAALGEKDLRDLKITEKDIVVGIAASGRTPYVIGGLKYANEMGALTGSVSCNASSEIGKLAKHPIEVEVGPEILTGSTRLKSGTAQKLVLNMISTGIMIGIGKVYQNLMIDVKPTNEKLVQRAINMISEVAGVEAEQAEQLFKSSGQDVKKAIVMGVRNVASNEAEQMIIENDGFIRPLMKG